MRKLKKITMERARKLIAMVKDNSGQGALDTAVICEPFLIDGGGKVMKKVRQNYFFKFVNTRDKINARLSDNSGQGSVETAIQILIAVVLGALILAGLYALMDGTVLPTLTQKVQEMFNYTN